MSAERGYFDLQQSLSIRVSQNTGLPQIQGRDGAGVEVRAVRLHCLVQYQPVETKSDLILEVKRIYDMPIKRQIYDNPDHRGFFYAACTDDDTMIKDQRLWFEMSLGFAKNPEEFKQNEKLEVGDECDWKPEDVLGKFDLLTLESFGSKVVGKIDNVGHHNWGPLAEFEAYTRQKDAEVAAKPDEFW